MDHSWPQHADLECSNRQDRRRRRWKSGNVSRENVARVAAVVLDKPNTVGKFIEFNDGDTPIEEAIEAAH